MNFLHHRQKSQGHVLPIPEGLQELMADISREVLRCQPSLDCTYKFIADYLEAMLRTREKSKIAMEIIEEAILKTDEVYEQFVKCSIPKDKTNSFLDMMEITFRRFVEQKRRLNQDPRLITFHADDILDELMRKCDLTKMEILRSRPAIQWAYKKFVKTYLAAIEGTLDTEDLYLNTEKLVASEKELKELNESAIKIQKVYRGYYTRKSLKDSQTLRGMQLSTAGSLTSFEVYTAEKEEELTKAAIKIQATYKGFQVRKKMDPHPLPDAVSDEDLFEKYAAENQEELTKAAIKIQATYKGFSARKKMPLLDEPAQSQEDRQQVEEAIQELIMEATENITELENLENDDDLDDLTKAAVKIQASFKGYKVRKEMQEKDNGNTLLSRPVE